MVGLYWSVKYSETLGKNSKSSLTFPKLNGIKICGIHKVVKMSGSLENDVYCGPDLLLRIEQNRGR